MNKPVRPAQHCRAGSLIPPKVVADFSVRQAQDPEPVEGPIGDMASVWKPTPTHSEGGVSDPALHSIPHA